MPGLQVNLQRGIIARRCGGCVVGWWWLRVIYLYTHIVIYIICVYDKIIIIIILGRYIIQNQQGLITLRERRHVFCQCCHYGRRRITVRCSRHLNWCLSRVIIISVYGVIACIYIIIHVYMGNERSFQVIPFFFEYLVFLKRAILFQSWFLSTTKNPIPKVSNSEGNHDSRSVG